MTSRRTGLVDCDGERIYWEVAGDGGDAVALCHGMGGNHASWWQQVPDLARDHRVLTWDQRGFGNSTARTGEVGPTPSVGDLTAVMEAAGIDDAHIVGQSMGGWVAMGWALAHPDRVRSLILTDTLAGVMTDEIGRLTAEAAKGLSFVADTLGEHPALGRRLVDGDPTHAYLYQLISSFGDRPPDGELFRRLGETRYPLDSVRAIAAPTLLIVGEHDPLCPPAAMRIIADLVPGARLEVIPGCGHSPYFEDTAAWNRIVRTALS